MSLASSSAPQTTELWNSIEQQNSPEQQNILEMFWNNRMFWKPSRTIPEPSRNVPELVRNILERYLEHSRTLDHSGSHYYETFRKLLPCPVFWRLHYYLRPAGTYFQHPHLPAWPLLKHHCTLRRRQKLHQQELLLLLRHAATHDDLPQVPHPAHW